MLDYLEPVVQFIQHEKQLSMNVTILPNWKWPRCGGQNIAAWAMW